MLRFLLPLLLLTALPAAAQEQLMRIVHDEKTDTHVEILALFSNPAPAGYLPVRVTIANNQTRTHTIQLTGENNNYYGRGGILGSSTFSLRAEPGKAVTRDFLVPTMAGVTQNTYGNHLAIRLSGTMGRSEHNYYQNFGADHPRILLSSRLFHENASAIDNAASMSFSSSYGGRSDFTSSFDPKQLPSEWQAYAGYDWLVVTDEEWSEIPAGQRNAILAWVRLGGNLDIRHRMSEFLPNRLNLPDDSGYGTITASPIPPNHSIDARQFISQIRRNSGSPPRGTSLTNDFSNRWPLQRTMDTKVFRYGMFVIILTFFMIIVGPVNLFFLAPAGRRHRLFMTTPLISLGASLLMVLLIIFQDGFGGTGRRIVLMEVRPDDGQHAAFIHQEQFSRTGILTRTGFEVPMPAMVHPVPLEKSRWARLVNWQEAPGTYALQPADGKITASGDWFQSRSEQGQFLSAVVPTRGRIERDANGAIVSTFPHKIDTLLFLDENAEWHIATNIATGTRTTLNPIPIAEASELLKTQGQNRLTPRLRGMLGRASTRKAHFIAFTSDAPAIDTHTSIKWQQTHTIITGPVVAP